MCSSDVGREKLFLGFVVLMSLICFCHSSAHVSSMPCNGSLTESCPASLFYVPNTKKSLQDTAFLFNVNADLVKRADDGFLILINCSCPPEHDQFTWHLDYSIQNGDTWESISSKFGSFVVEKPGKALIPSRVVTLDVLCGCSESADMLVTYRVEKGDTLFAICSRFNADLSKTALLNGLQNPDLIYEGDIMFVPVPGVWNLTLHHVGSQDMKSEKASKSRIHVVVGAISAVFIVILLIVVLLYQRNNMNRRKRARRSQQCGAFSWRRDCLHCYLDACPYHTKSEETTVSSLNSDKAIALPYDEIRDATSNFNMSLKIGQGSHGSVYLGKLRGRNVAVKQMKSTKSKEFLAELKILCRVHHTNLIELLGYAAGGDFLFLVYDFVQNGALSDHLHRHRARGYKPLPWTTRVQIALDAAKGLEYIHEHTKPFYVHRDVKTSNILLDSNFRAKIADFGLVKLLEHSMDIGAAASRIVGTFGYLAPEYARDGHVTTKNDVYSFGVVLMELLTGQPALSKNTGVEKEQDGEVHSLVQYVLSALNYTEDPFGQLTKCIDPNLSSYHQDSLFQMALLSKECVNENWNLRPDMSSVVLRLSHILLRSKEWEEVDCNYLTA